MALKATTIGLVRRALGLTKQPALCSAPVSNLPQRCLLSTSHTPTLLHNTSGSSPSNLLGRVNEGKLTLLQQPPQTVRVQQCRDYHSVLRPRLHCKGCYFVWRHGRKYVECSDMPSHKQMKKVANRKLWREDYTRGNVRKAMMWNRDLARISDRTVDRNVMSHNWLASRIGRDV